MDVEYSTQIPFQFEDTDGFIELCFDAEDRQTTDARQRDCSTKGWLVRPHRSPSRVSSYNCQYYLSTCMHALLDQSECYQSIWQFDSSSFS